MNKDFKSGFITIIGKPNVGKSTLLNSIIGHKIAIMSSKPQTTRNTILGIYTDDEAQIVFTDTPGIHKPHHELGKIMNESSYDSIKGVDAVFFMVTALDEPRELDKMIIENLSKIKKPIYLIINKIDLLRKTSDLDRVIVSYMNLLNFAGIFPVSALEKTNVPNLIEDLKKLIPNGPKYYPDDMICDHPERFIVGELIREKVLELTREEVPHSVAVVVESMKKAEDNPNLVEIFATIYVERDSQKKIIIGKSGELIKEIGKRARLDINNLLGSKSHLDLWIKVKKDWTDRPDVLKTLGYSNDNY